MKIWEAWEARFHFPWPKHQEPLNRLVVEAISHDHPHPKNPRLTTHSFIHSSLWLAMVHYTLRRRIRRRVLVLRRCIQHVMDRILTCCLGKPVHYRMLPISVMTPPSGSVAGPNSAASTTVVRQKSSAPRSGRESVDSDLVALKISLLGDSQIGKTSFLVIFDHVPYIIRKHFVLNIFSSLHIN